MFKKFQPNRTYVIAEIGGNFTTYEEAVKLIDLAQKAGCDAVKLQTFRANTLVTRDAVFDMENTGVVPQYQIFEKYEVSDDLHRKIFSYIQEKNLDWFSTPSHQTDVDLLERLGVGAHKVGSDDAVNLPLLRRLARTGKPILLSTGMCTMEEVRESVDAILAEGNDRLFLLHAITSYPTHPEHVNLGVISTFKREFPNLVIGYSDHTLGITACLCAVAMGAQVIEKHFTHDKKAEGPDHMLSADYAEMKELVDRIREFEVMRGTGIKRPADSEAVTRKNNRKSLVILEDVPAGGTLTERNLGVKRPGTGIGPKYYDQLLGRKVSSSLKKDQVLKWSDL
jgi:N-acetylneuraminate synthase